MSGALVRTNLVVVLTDTIMHCPVCSHSASPVYVNHLPAVDDLPGEMVWTNLQCHHVVRSSGYVPYSPAAGYVAFMSKEGEPVDQPDPDQGHAGVPHRGGPRHRAGEAALAQG